VREAFENHAPVAVSPLNEIGLAATWLRMYMQQPRVCLGFDAFDSREERYAGRELPIKLSATARNILAFVAKNAEVQTFLETARENSLMVFATDQTGFSLLTYLVAADRQDVVRALFHCPEFLRYHNLLSATISGTGDYSFWNSNSRGILPLIFNVIQTSTVEMMRVLIMLRPDVLTVTGPTGASPLQFAIVRRKQSHAQVLLTYAGQIEHRDALGNNAAHTLILCGDWKVLVCMAGLSESAQKAVWMQGHAGKTVLMIALDVLERRGRYANWASFEMLLDMGIKWPYEFLEQSSAGGFTVMHKAVVLGGLSCVPALALLSRYGYLLYVRTLRGTALDVMFDRRQFALAEKVLKAFPQMIVHHRKFQNLVNRYVADRMRGQGHLQELQELQAMVDKTFLEYGEGVPESVDLRRKVKMLCAVAEFDARKVFQCVSGKSKKVVSLQADLRQFLLSTGIAHVPENALLVEGFCKRLLELSQKAGKKKASKVRSLCSVLDQMVLNEMKASSQSQMEDPAGAEPPLLLVPEVVSRLFKVHFEGLPQPVVSLQLICFREVHKMLRQMKLEIDPVQIPGLYKRLKLELDTRESRQENPVDEPQIPLHPQSSGFLGDCESEMCESRKKAYSMDSFCTFSPGRHPYGQGLGPLHTVGSVVASSSGSLGLGIASQSSCSWSEAMTAGSSQSGRGESDEGQFKNGCEGRQGARSSNRAAVKQADGLDPEDDCRSPLSIPIIDLMGFVFVDEVRKSASHPALLGAKDFEQYSQAMGF
jgi:hypothetical protein